MKTNEVKATLTHTFYHELAPYYDYVYLYVDYKRQAHAFTQLIKKYRQNANNSLLDACCGTGGHDGLLKANGFHVTGLDLSSDMLNVARKNNPGIPYVKGDMKTFRINQRFGTILCFFNSILYNQDKAQLTRALQNFYKHLQPGGILIFDAVDKSVGIGDKRGDYKYAGADHTVAFKPLWKLNRKQNVMDLHIDFEIDGKAHHDHHVMGAFTLEELKQHAENIGFQAFLLQRNFEFPRKEEALFVCRKPL